MWLIYPFEMRHRSDNNKHESTDIPSFTSVVAPMPYQCRFDYGMKFAIGACLIAGLIEQLQTGRTVGDDVSLFVSKNNKMFSFRSTFTYPAAIEFLVFETYSLTTGVMDGWERKRKAKTESDAMVSHTLMNFNMPPYARMVLLFSTRNI